MKHYKNLRYVLCVLIAFNPLLVTYTHSITIPMPVIVEAVKAATAALGGAGCVALGRQITHFVRRNFYRTHEQNASENHQSQQAQPIAQEPKQNQASASTPIQQVPQAPILNLDSIFKLPFEQQTSKPFFDCGLQGILRNTSQCTTLSTPIESAIPVPINTQSTSSTPQATTRTQTHTQTQASVHVLPQPTEHISAASFVSMPVISQKPVALQVAAPDSTVRDLALKVAYVKARVDQAQAQTQSQVYTPTTVQVPVQTNAPVHTPVRTQTSTATSVSTQARVDSPTQPKIYWSEEAIRILAGVPAQTADQSLGSMGHTYDQMSRCASMRTGVPAHMQTQVVTPIYTKPSTTSAPSDQTDRDIYDYQRDEQFDKYLEQHPQKRAHYNQEVDSYISLLITICGARAPFVERYRALLQINSYRMAGSWGRHLSRLVRKLNRLYFDTSGALKSLVQDKASLKEMENLLLHFFAYASKTKQQFNNCIQFAQSRGVLCHCSSQIRTIRDNLRYYNDRTSLVSSYSDALNGAGQSVVTSNIQNALYREFAKYATINSQLLLQALVENAARAEEIFIEQGHAFSRSLTTQQMHAELTQLYHHIGSLSLQNGGQCSASEPVLEHRHMLNPEGIGDPAKGNTQQIPGAPPLDIPLPRPNSDIPDIKLPNYTCGTSATLDLPKYLGPDTINPGDNIKPRPCNYSQMSNTPQIEITPQVTNQTPQPDPDQDGADIIPEQIPQVQGIPVSIDAASDEKYIEEEIERILNQGIATIEDIKKRFTDNSAFLPNNVPTNVRERLKQQFLDSMQREIALAEEHTLENALQVEKQLTTKELKDKQTTAPSFLDQYLPVVPRCLREIQKVSQEKLNEYIKGNIACINRAKQQALAKGKPYISEEVKGLYIEETDTAITLIDAVGKVIERYRKLETGEWCRYLIPDLKEILDILERQKAIEAWAEQMYNIFRNRNDIDVIAKNTGLPKYWIKLIKDHVFYNNHILFEGIRRFHADSEMASAWERLYRGDFIVNDIRLLEHEYFELKIEKWGNLSYSTAHKIVQEKANGKPWYDPLYSN